MIEIDTMIREIMIDQDTIEVIEIREWIDREIMVESGMIDIQIDKWTIEIIEGSIRVKEITREKEITKRGRTIREQIIEDMIEMIERYREKKVLLLKVKVILKKILPYPYPHI